MGVAMRADRPRVKHEICPCRYWSHVVRLQRPSFCIIESETPFSLSCMAPDARREWVLGLLKKREYSYEKEKTGESVKRCRGYNGGTLWRLQQRNLYEVTK
jgi:hypothetical protein